MTTPSGIHGQILEVTVVGCHNLKDTEWISRQDPYVCLEYASTKFRTRTCTDGNKNPTFNEKFTFSLIEGLREITVGVWNSNTLQHDDFIGSGKILLNKVLSQGYDDSAWPILSKRGRNAGEVKLILHYAALQKQGKPTGAAAAAAPPSPYPYGAAPPPPYPSAQYPPPSGYPSYGQTSIPTYPPTPYPPPYAPHPPPASSYPPASYPPQPASYPPQPSIYPPPTYPPSTYPPQPYPPSQPAYPYPPVSGIYPPPPRY